MQTSPNTGGNAPLLTVAPVAAPGQSAIHVEFIRLPAPGTLHPVFGLTRSYLNSLVLPTETNGHKPPVKSVCLRKKGAKTGVRLICVDSLRAFLAQHIEGGAATTNEKGGLQ